MSTIKHYLIINSPIEKVYKAITEQNGLASWWTEDTTGKPEVETTIDFIFGEIYHDKMLITNLVLNGNVHWVMMNGLAQNSNFCSSQKITQQSSGLFIVIGKRKQIFLQIAITIGIII